MEYVALERRLKNAGCCLMRTGKRHTIWYSPITGKNFTVPRGMEYLLPRTAQAIQEIAGILYG